MAWRRSFPRGRLRASKLGTRSQVEQCGSGITTSNLAHHFRRLLAVDGSAAAVEHARREVSGMPHVDIVKAVLPLDLPAAAFDAVIASEVLYYLPRSVLHEVLADIDRAVRPGGRLIMANHFRRFSDAEHTLEQLTAKVRRRFGPARWIYVWGRWQVAVFIKRDSARRSLCRL